MSGCYRRDSDYRIIHCSTSDNVILDGATGSFYLYTFI